MHKHKFIVKLSLQFRCIVGLVEIVLSQEIDLRERFDLLRQEFQINLFRFCNSIAQLACKQGRAHKNLRG